MSVDRERLPFEAVTLFLDGHIDIIRFETAIQRDSLISKLKDSPFARAITVDQAKTFGFIQISGGYPSVKNYRDKELVKAIVQGKGPLLTA